MNHITNRRCQRLSGGCIVDGRCGVSSAAALLQNIKMDILQAAIKPVRFLGDSLRRLRAFPDGVRHDVGYQIWRVQLGEPADDFKPMPTIGPGVEEIRVRDVTGAYRVIYTARLADAVYVLHVFQKKTRGTPRADIELAARRFRMLVRGRG